MSLRISALAGCLLFLALAGCQSTPAPAPMAMPDLNSQISPTHLKLGWNGETVQIPTPVVIPAEYIRDNFPAWAKAGYPSQWPVKLSDGRTAVMTAARIRGSDGLHFAVPSITVYRRDGTREMEQTNAGNPYPGPNQISFWNVYEADGKTMKMEIVYGQHFTFYQDGKPIREYQVNKNVVEIEYAILPDGTRKETHSITAIQQQ